MPAHNRLIGLQVINLTGSDIAADQLVAISGYDTASKLVKIVLANAATADLATDVYVTPKPIKASRQGFVWKGYNSSTALNTGSISIGTTLYLSDATPGGFTSTAPTAAGSRVVVVGYCQVSSATIGKIDWDIKPPSKFGSNDIQSGTAQNSIVLDATNQDVVLKRDAAGILAQVNSTNAQAMRFYNTFTDASNYERGLVGWSGNQFVIGTQQAGSGSARVIRFQTASTNVWEITTGGTFNDVGTHAITAGGAITGGSFVSTGKLTSYNAIATAGQGLPAIYNESISATQTAGISAATYTPPATAGRYEVSAVITTTSATNTGTVQVTVDYVDSQGTTHTGDIIPLVDAAGSIAVTKSGASKEYHSLPWKLTINNSATAIILKVVVVGSVSYTVSPTVKQEG